MIRKIRREEYLKGYGAMSDGERKDYLKRVGEWLSDGGRRLLEATERPMAKAQNIVLLSARWKEQEVTMFAEGVQLLSALMDVADTWLPTQLYAKSAYRAVRNMVEVMVDAYERAVPVGTVVGDFVKTAGKPGFVEYTYIGKGNDKGGAAAPYNLGPNGAAGAKPAQTGGTPSSTVGKPTGTVAGGSLVITEEQKQRIVEKYTKKAMAKMAAKEEPTEGTSKATQAVAVASIPATKPDYGCKAVKLVPVEECQSMPGLNNHVYSAIPPRPKHIDQYVHLLPEKTQERAKQYGPLKREIEAARENMRLLMNDPHSSAADREKWAKLAARNDEKIAKINAELDREWEKVAATGRVVVDDLGMAHLLPADGEAEEKQEAAEPAVTQQETQPETESQGPLALNPEPEKRKPGRPKKQPEMSDEEKAKRREYLKKWLRDTRTNPSDERRKQWTKNCKELLALGGEITDSIRKAGEYYGAKLPSE